MKVLLSTLAHDPGAVHGGPIIAQRHAQALANQGIEVRVAAPDAKPPGAGYGVDAYRSRMRGPFPEKRRNPASTRELDSLFARFHPDLLYDVHGPAWAIEVALRRRVPVVSMVGDYGWFCRRTALVDAEVRRCTGPDSLEKCFDCINRGYGAGRQAAHHLVRAAGELASRRRPPPESPWVGLFVWDLIVEADRYIADLRTGIDRFVVGDGHAREFFLSHGIAADRLVEIAQCLPFDALRVRRNAGVVDSRPRPLRIAFVGRVSAEKGLHVLARAFQALPESAAVELWIVHAMQATSSRVGPLFGDQRRFAAALESGRIRLLRPENSSGVFDLMARADVGIVPSIAFESPSLALLEFVAQRTPVVRSESGGMQHVIQDGVNGRTFPCGDSAALARILEEILGDRSILDRWRERLPQVGSDSTYAAALRKVFVEVLGSAPRSATGRVALAQGRPARGSTGRGASAIVDWASGGMPPTRK